ncbi:MAG: amino acid permease [Phycisphaeraceae bacterium]
MAILSESRRLKKELSLFSVYTLATGATLSSGFFLLPGLAAAEAGPAVVASYLLAVVPLLPGILSKIELATAMPRAGGEYYFMDRSLGPMVGTITGLGTWCGLVLKTAFALIGIGAYLGVFFPGISMTPFVVGAAVVFGIINLFGAHKSGAFQVLLVMGLLFLLVWFTATGLGHVQTDHFSGFMDKGWGQLVATAGLVCISFMGLTNVASVAEEVKNPERNLTLGILLALLTSVLVYGLGTYVIVGVVRPAALYGSLTPVADAAEVMVGHTGAVVMTVAAILAFLSVANAGILSASRYPLAMSRDHLLPRWFRRLNKHKTPHHAIFVTVAMILLCVTIDPTMIAKLASAFLLLLFAFNCLAVVVMRESRIDSYDPGFRCPWYPWLQIIGIVGPVAFIVVMGWLPILFTAGLIIVGTAWYFYYARHRVQRGGAIYHLLARLGQRRFEGLDRELRGILKEKGLRAGDPYDEVVARAAVLDEPSGVTFEQVVQKASEQLAAHLPLSAEQLAANFMEGTRVGATPVAKGIALPHLRMPGLKHPLMVLARIAGGVHVDVKVDFVDHSADQAIYAVIFLVSPEEDAARHLRILAQIAQHVDDQQYMNDWLAAENEQALKEILLREERFLSLHLRSDSPSAALIAQAVRDLPLPEGSLIALVDRAGEMIVPSGNTVLKEGDRLTIVGLPESIEQLKAKYQDS